MSQELTYPNVYYVFVYTQRGNYYVHDEEMADKKFVLSLLGKIIFGFDF